MPVRVAGVNAWARGPSLRRAEDEARWRGVDAEVDDASCLDRCRTSTQSPCEDLEAGRRRRARGRRWSSVHTPADVGEARRRSRINGMPSLGCPIQSPVAACVSGCPAKDDDEPQEPARQLPAGRWSRSRRLSASVVGSSPVEGSLFFASKCRSNAQVRRDVAGDRVVRDDGDLMTSPLFSCRPLETSTTQRIVAEARRGRKWRFESGLEPRAAVMVGQGESRAENGRELGIDRSLMPGVLRLAVRGCRRFARLRATVTRPRRLPQTHRGECRRRW